MLQTLFKMISLLLGGGSILYFTSFLIFGTSISIHLNMSAEKALLIDFCLCLLFFGQHSIMVRKEFKRRLQKYIPSDIIPGFFSIISGITLVFVILFWQGSGDSFIQVPGWISFVSGCFFILSLAGFYWGVSSLKSGSFDPFGLRTKRVHVQKKQELKLKGPYKFMRHPLYFFAILLIWASTEFTYDRLMFNFLWTGWIILGTWFEEKELVDLFGEDYKVYQEKVPMLLPKKLMDPGDFF